MERYFTELATAFVRGRLDQPQATIEAGLEAGLRLHKFKQDAGLPRIRRVLGILRGLQSHHLLEVGSGRWTFLWPLLAEFPELHVTSAESADRLANDLAAVRREGIERLTVVRADIHCLPSAPRSFDVATILEVLEHLAEPQRALKATVG